MIPKMGMKVKHLKTKNWYNILHIAQNSDEPEQKLVVYQIYGNNRAPIWVRDYEEFCDGRFEEDI